MKDNKKQLIELCTEHFFLHPHWESLLSLIELYVEPLKSINAIDAKGKTNDELATEVRARQITVERLEAFIKDTLTLKEMKKSVPKTTRKYR